MRESELNTDLEANIPCASVEGEELAGNRADSPAIHEESPEDSNQTPQNQVV